MKRHIYLNMKPVEEARALFLSRFDLDTHLPPEETLTAAALGRVTAAPVFAKLSSPHYHSAAMDGYAVAAEATFGASQDKPLLLELGWQAFPVNTGNALPGGTNAVIMVENVDPVDETHIQIEAAAYPWQHVRKVGEDLVAHEMVLPEKTEVTPYAMGALLAAGVTRLLVRRRPRVIIIPTGDELISVQEIEAGPVPPGRIIEFNSVMLSALVEQLGALAQICPIVADRREEIKKALTAALEQGDMVIINAGSSAGTEDHTAQVIAELGEVLVHGVTMMPGKPTILGVVQGKPIMGNPGYPVSAALSFDQFAAPLLVGLLGRRMPPRPVLTVQPAQKIPSKAGLEEFIRVTLGQVGDRIMATPLPRGAGTITSLVRADGLIRIPAASEGIDAEKPVLAELLLTEEQLWQTLVVIGSHDNTLDVLATLLRRHHPALRLSSAHVGSTGGLMALKNRRAHFGGSHLFDPQTDSYNVPYIQRLLPDLPLKLVNLVHRAQGLMVLPGNPKNIMGFQDLTRPDVRFSNRQRGSGTRILLDYQLEQLKLSPDAIPGYDEEEYTHMAVAVNVLSGAADTGLGIMAAAKALGLDFIPVVTERYDLVVPETTWTDEHFQKLLEIIRSEEFKATVAALGGYDTKNTGDIMYEQ
jgi:molybdopterin molybdotransferase/putative molybdopterin biosynthesis protein